LHQQFFAKLVQPSIEERKMRTRLIPHAEWFPFFEAFTRRHPGSPTTVWLLGPHIGAQVEARDLPLEGIVADPLGTTITISLGGPAGGNVEHPVPQPMAVWEELTEDGAEQALGINSADGTTTLVEFRTPISARMVGRVAADAASSVPSG
jgi:hypothetical protein